MKKPVRIFSHPVARTTIVAILLLILAAGVASACPSCKETVAGANEGLATGLSYSVLGMMSMPFLLVAIVGAIVVRAYHRAAAGRSGDEQMPI